MFDPASSYQKEGTFTVVGRVAGVSMPIIANVKVTAKHIVGKYLAGYLANNY
jgi:hypothetical protein